MKPSKPLDLCLEKLELEELDELDEDYGNAEEDAGEEGDAGKEGGGEGEAEAKAGIDDGGREGTALLQLIGHPRKKYALIPRHLRCAPGAGKKQLSVFIKGAKRG